MAFKRKQVTITGNPRTLYYQIFKSKEVYKIIKELNPISILIIKEICICFI